MKRVVVVTLLLFGSVFAFPHFMHPAHGSFTGLVCLTRATNPACPQVPLTFNATVGKSLTIGVYVNNSDAMGGFDIYVQSDNSVLNPTGAALGPLIASPSLTSICINGVATIGSCTVGTANGPGVVEVTTIESSGGDECGGISPCSGLAFTITYTVLSAAASTTLAWPTAAGCAASSVSTPADVCVEVADHTGTILTENIQTPAGYFTSLNPTANFHETPTNGLAPLVVTFDATLSNATVGNTITRYNWDFGDGITANLTSPTTTHTYTLTGSFTPNLEIVDSSNAKSLLKYGLAISVGIPDFSINANPTSLFFVPGKSGISTISLASLSGFSGIVNISANSSIPLGLTSTLNHASVNLASGQIDSSTTLNVTSTASTPLGSYAVNVTGTSGALKHSVFISIDIVPMLYSLSNSGPITAIRGSSGTNTITLTLSSGTGQPVTPSCVNLPTGASCLFLPATVTPTITGSTTALTITTSASTPPNSYSITVTGTPQHATNTTVTLAVQDFQMSANPPSVSIPQGGNGATVITLNSQFGFRGDITLAENANSPKIVGFLNRTSLSLTATSNSNSSSLYIIALSGITPGPYIVTVTGTMGSLSHNFNVTVNIPIPSFGASATPTSVSVKTGANGTSAITLTSLNGFAGTVNLQATAPPNAGITTLFSSGSVTVDTSGPVTSTLTIMTASTTPSGTYTIRVNGTTANLFQLVNITLTVISPLPSLQVGSASLSTASTTAGNSVDMTVTISNTGTTPVNITLTMDINSGTGSNITVAQQTITLLAGQAAQTVKLSWNTTTWTGGSYHVYARVIGSQTSAVNQALTAGTVALASPPPSPAPANLSVIPWITTGALAVVVLLLGLLLFRRRRPSGMAESA